MPTQWKPKLQLQLDEVDMIAYIADAEEVCRFDYNDNIESDRYIERARDVVSRVNAHEFLLLAARQALRELREFYLDRDSQAIVELKEAIALATGEVP